MDESESDGGPGGLSRRVNTQFELRAIMQGWTLPPNIRVKIQARLCKLIDEDADHGGLGPPGHREVIAASRALMHGDLEQQKIDLARKESENPTIRDAQAEAESLDRGYQPPGPPPADQSGPTA